jgi:hypothetical protein
MTEFLLVFVANFYNRKYFHNIILETVCDCDMFFWNACVGQLGGVVNEG